ncbi:MAG: hypothetical protein JW953_01660 [Anaerolineae bacterium]|nr:hypothetical protein [Anaerolineae bacterium]
MKKKYLGLLLSMLVIFSVFLACGDEEAAEPSTVEPPGVEAAADEEPEVEAPLAEAPTQAPVEPTEVKGEADSSMIPEECLADEDALQACWDNGLIPPECVDDEGYLLDECLAPGQTAGGGAAPPASSDDLGAEAADSGFRPEVNGFSFENYGAEAEASNMTPAEMQRMFGEQVCANMANGCTLTPPARQWLEQVNESMSEGHCEGMAVLSDLMYFGQVNPADFGSSVAHDLELVGNEPLQREIAYWFVTQATYPGGFMNRVNESPSAVLDTLIEAFSQGQNAAEWWVMGIYKPDFSGGHAITPFAVEDQGNGLFHIYVYDNNYPDQARIVQVDRQANTWAYEASINPGVEADLYEGDAETQSLEVVAISPRLQPQEANFETAFVLEQRPVGLAAPLLGQQYAEVWLDGDTNLLITDEQGRRIGWVSDTEFVNEIPGAQTTNFKYAVDVWEVDQEPVYLLPLELDFFTITVDGSHLTEAGAAEVTIIGPGYDLVVEDLWLDPGEKDEIDVTTLDKGVYALSYRTEYSESPDIWIGLETDEADYEFVVRGADIEPGGEFHVALDFPVGDFILNTTGNQEYGTYELLVLRIDDEGEYVFGHDDITMEPDDTMYVNFLEWAGEDSVMYLDFDYGSDGSIDETIELEDEEDFYEDFYEDWEE